MTRTALGVAVALAACASFAADDIGPAENDGSGEQGCSIFFR